MADKILLKIHKLLNQQKGEEQLGNQAAAESFALKIQELLIKHKLELSDVDRVAEEQGNPIVYRTIKPGAWGEQSLPKRVEWVEHLADVIGRAYYVRSLAMIDSNDILLVGRQFDVDLATFVFCKVMRTGLNICEAELAEVLLTHETALDTNYWQLCGGNEDFRYSFFIGYNGSIEDRLQTQKRRLELQAGETTALVRATKEVDAAVEAINPAEDAQAQKVHRLMHRAFNKGLKFGADVNLDPNAMAAGTETNKLNGGS